MSRRKADPVDIAFRAWAALDTEGKQRLADRVAGYQEAMGVVSAPAPRVRQRKPKVNGGVYSPEPTSTHPLNPPKGGSGVPLPKESV